MVEVFAYVLGINMSEPTGLKSEQKYTNFTSLHGLFSCQSRIPITSSQKLRYFLVPFLQTRLEQFLKRLTDAQEKMKSGGGQPYDDGSMIIVPLGKKP